MRVWLYLGIAVCLAGIAAVLYGTMPSPRDARIVQSANPEDGKVIGGILSATISIFRIGCLTS